MQCIDRFASEELWTMDGDGGACCVTSRPELSPYVSWPVSNLGAEDPERLVEYHHLFDAHNGMLVLVSGPDKACSCQTNVALLSMFLPGVLKPPIS